MLYEVITIYNGTGSAVDLADYELRMYANGATSPSNTTALSGTLNDGSVVVYRNSSATLYSSATAAAAVSYNFV